MLRGMLRPAARPRPQVIRAALQDFAAGQNVAERTELATYPFIGTHVGIHGASPRAAPLRAERRPLVSALMGRSRVMDGSLQVHAGVGGQGRRWAGGAESRDGRGCLVSSNAAGE